MRKRVTLMSRREGAPNWGTRNSFHGQNPVTQQKKLDQLVETAVEQAWMWGRVEPYTQFRVKIEDQ
jgi:hypothetical protein